MVGHYRAVDPLVMRSSRGNPGQRYGLVRMVGMIAAGIAPERLGITKDQSSNDQGDDGRKIGDGDAMGGSKHQQHGPLNRTLDKGPDSGGCDQTDRQPHPAAYGGLVEESAWHRARVNARRGLAGES
jgi:hypothetical protein